MKQSQGSAETICPYIMMRIVIRIEELQMTENDERAKRWGGDQGDKMG